MKKILSVITAMSFLSPTFAIAEDAVKAPAPAAKAVGSACVAGGVAHLASAKAKVLLSRGGSFSDIQDGAPLSAGDRILVREGSAGVVVGKILVSQVGAGSMLAISGKDGGFCAAQVTSNPGVVAADLPYHKGPVEVYQPASTPGFDPLWLGAGALAVGAGVGIGCAIWCGHHGNTPQPFPVPTPVSG